MQSLNGDYFSIDDTYAQTMGIFIAAATAAYVQTRDPVVAWVTTWFIVGLAAVASAIAPMFAVSLVLFIDTIQGVKDFFEKFVLRNDASSDAEGQCLNDTYGTVCIAFVMKQKQAVAVITAK
ncbi:hypothetical protein ON010_g2530 [Phytophthora cinnamomi]|nr:hypothetical protein ON010_g2530 [Phytophthora cinnamomi]